MCAWARIRRGFTAKSPTWTPSAQGASAQATYAATGAGANLEFTGATSGADRTNYNVTVAGSILRVAENP